MMFCWSDINVAESPMWRTTGVRSMTFLLFVLYSADVIKIAAGHGVSIRAYADDINSTQIY